MHFDPLLHQQIYSHCVTVVLLMLCVLGNGEYLPIQAHFLPQVNTEWSLAQLAMAG